MAARRPSQPNESMERGITCLLELASSERPLSVSELARRLGVERTRVSRMLGTLGYLGLAQRLSDRRYSCGPGIHVLAALSLRTSGLLRVTLPLLRRLRHEHGLDSALGVLWRTQVCYLYHSAGEETAEAGVGGHELYPADVSSIGRVLLAAMTDQEVGRLGAEAEGIWVTPADALLRSLAAVRRDGYAENPGASVAVAVGDPPLAAVAAVGVGTGPSPSRALPLLRKVAAEAVARLDARSRPGLMEADRRRGR